MADTITTRVLDASHRPSVATMYAAAQILVQEHRVLEAAYGAAQLILCKPSTAQRSEIRAEIQSVADRILTEGEAGAISRCRLGHPLIDHWIPHIPLRPHCATRCGKVTIAGEYAEDGARLFLLTADQVTVCDYYRRESGVRHIHCVHALDSERFLVSTGDSARRLDLWRIEGRRLQFDRRLMRRLAGFTAAATVRGQIYLGSDFSSRPNYLLRLRDRTKFFLPDEAFRKYVYCIEPIDDRYLIIGSKALEIVGGARSVSIFDAGLDRFVVGN